MLYIGRALLNAECRINACNFLYRYVNPRLTSVAPPPGEENGMTTGRGKKTPGIQSHRAKRARVLEGSPSVLTPTQ